MLVGFVGVFGLFGLARLGSGACVVGCNHDVTGWIYLNKCYVYSPRTCRAGYIVVVNQGISCVVKTPLVEMKVYICPDDRCTNLCNPCQSIEDCQHSGSLMVPPCYRIGENETYFVKECNQYY